MTFATAYLRDQTGGSSAEYALMLAVIALAVGASLYFVGSAVSAGLLKVTNAISETTNQIH